MLIQGLFLVSFTLSFFGALITFTKINKEPIQEVPVVLAEATEMPTVTPSPSPTPTPTVKPTIKSTPKPMPTVTATSTPLATPTPLPTPTPDVWSPPDLEPIFSRYAGQYGVDKNILERLANCESHFNPNARSGDYLGLFQFSTSTWINYRQKIGADPNLDLRTNPEESIKTAAYLVSIRGTAPWPACLR